MKLFILVRISDKPIYDVCDGKIIRAKTAALARQMANVDVWDEGEIWTDPNKVTCEELLFKGEPGVILEDRNPG